MADSQFSRSEMVLGKSSTEKLHNSGVILFGLGGVGSYAAEALARAGIGRITIVDNDTVNETNINRQLCALHSTIGMKKTDVVVERIKDINPDCKVNPICNFYLPENSEEFETDKYDYIIDAIDTVSAKIDLAEKAFASGTAIISCMGTGNKTDPSKFVISDIYKTSVCPLCRVMRTELKKRKIPGLTVLWSAEEPVKTHIDDEETGRHSPGSVSFVPGVAGLMIAGKVIKDILDKD